MNIEFDLMKKVYQLSRKEKEILLANFDSITLASQKTSLIKVASGIHDPETVEDIRKLLDVLEKFIGLDEDITYDNLSVFIHPLSNSSRKLVLRPCKMISIVKNLARLSREYAREKENGTPEVLGAIVKDFRNEIARIRRRLEKADSENKDGEFLVENPDDLMYTPDKVLMALNGVEHMMKTSSLTMDEVIEVISRPEFILDNKDQVVSILRKIK